MSLSKEALERIRKNKEKIQNGSMRDENNGGKKEEEKTSTSSGSGVKLSNAALERIKRNKEKIQNGSMRYSSDVVDDSYLDSFFRDSQDFLNDAKTSYNKLDYNSAVAESSKSYFDDLAKRENDLRNRATTIRDYLSTNRSRFDDDSYKELSSYLDIYSGDSISKAFYDARDYYSQWETEDDWKAAYAASQEYEKKSKLDVEEAQKEIDEMESVYNKVKSISSNIGMGGQESDDYQQNQINEILQQYGVQTERELEALLKDKKNYLAGAEQVQTEVKEKQEYEKKLAFYNAFTQSADFSNKSTYKSTYRGGEKFNAWSGMYSDTGYDDITYDYINKDETAMGRMLVNDIASNAAFLGLDTSYLKEMTNDEIAIYNYLYDPNDKTASDEYLAFLLSDLTYLQRKRAQEEWASYAAEHPVLSSGFSIMTSPLKILSTVGQTADYADDGSIDQNAAYNKFSYIPSAIREQVSSDIAKPQNGVWGEVGSWTYQLGMSMGDFLVNSAISGGNSAISLALMGSGAMADTVVSAKDRGLSDDQAMILGVVAGAAEVVTEKFSLDALLKGDLSKGAMRYILTNAFTEGTEEVSSSLINTVADVLVSKDKSEWKMAIQDYLYRNPGASEKEAFQKVLGDSLLSLGLDFLGGSLMGGAMGTGGAVVNYVTNARPGIKENIEAKNLYGDYTKELIEEGLASDPKSDSYDLAKYYQKKTAKGKSLTGYEIRQLVEANEAQFAVENYEEALSLAEGRLKELGETDNVDKLAKIVAKRASGQELTKAEKSTLVRSRFGSKVAKEMTPKATEKTYKPLEKRISTEGRFNVSESGKTVIRDTKEEIDIKKMDVATVGKGQMAFKVAENQEVYAGDIDFADESQSRLVSGVSNIENITTDAASVAIHSYDASSGQTVGEYLNGFDEAFTYGYNNYSVEDMKAGNFTTNLSNEMMMSAYKLGQSARATSDMDADAPIMRMRTAAQAKLTAKQQTAQQKARFEADAEVYLITKEGSGTVKFDEGLGTTYEGPRMGGVRAAKLLSKMGIGGKYYFYESYVEDGVRVYKDENGVVKEAPNGIYRDKTGSIYIDLNAGDKADGTTLFTLGHELTHFIKARSKTQYKVLCDLVTEAFAKTNISMHERVLEKQALLGEGTSYQYAYEEVVCDAMSTMISDGNFFEKVARIKARDKGLFNSIKQFFENMFAKFQEIYAKLTPDQQDARDIRDMKDMFERIQDAFAKALVEASENFQVAMESVVKENAKPVAAEEIITEGAVVTNGEGDRLSIRAMKHDIAEGKMFEDLKTVCNWTDAQVNVLRNQLIDLVDYMTPYRDILDMNEAYGMEGRRFSPYKPNSDPLYKISMDFSTLCSKRLLTQYVIEQLQLREKRPMSAEEQMAIRDMLNEYRKVEKGLQVACAMCYVEAARLKSPKQIQRWIDDPAPHLINYFAMKNTEFNNSVKKAQADFKESKGYDRNAPKKDMKPADVKELNKIGPKMRSKYQPSAEEQAIIERAKALPKETYLTAGNLADLSENESVIYNAYTSFVRTATRSKSLEQDEPYYYGDSTRDNGNGIVVTDSFIEAVNRENGMRFSSWSDWRIQHLLDYITAVIDNSVRGAAMHGYTKFGDEVRVLGKTGMMFNMSGVAGTQTGLNEDGSLSFSETESIDVNEAIQLREEFPETAGLQCIGVSNDHIIALLRSDIIDYVIPYHVSGLNKALRTMAKIQGWDDYTGTQNASIDKSIKLENAVDKEHWHEEPVFSEFFVGYDTGMTGIEAMRASAEKYKQMCKDRGLIPKFNQFATEENYWKLLIDRKMINQQTGKLIQQRAVTPTFDFDVIKGVVDKFVDNYDSGLEARALKHITDNWDSIPQRIKDLKKQGNTKTKKAVKTLANQTVAAQPNNGDKFSMRETVEETKDLLAYHNISAKLLSEVLNRNSLLMPSVAITNMVMTDFGEISLLFDKSSIDPNANEQNKLYGSDAWTPNQIELKKNAKFDTDKTVNAVNGIKDRIGSKYVPDLFNITAKQFRDAIIKKDGSIYDAFAHNIGMQTAYALENGIISEIPTNKNGTVNKAALESSLREALANNGWRPYKAWLNNISDTVIKSYDKATNEDIIKNMKAQPATAKTFKLTENGKLIVPAKEYTNIDEARKNKNRLSENAEEATKAVANEFLTLAQKIGGNTKATVNAINAAFANRYSTADIVRTFDSQGVKISSETAGELQALYKKAVELPTEYFEAKPHREVGLNEVKAVVMPAGTEYAKLKSKLEEQGISVVEYKAGSKKARVEALNSMEDLKFSEREGYDTRNLAWAIESGVINESDQARFWEAIAEIQKLKYNSFARTKNGGYIIETVDKMMFTDGDYKAPTLSKVIVFPYGEFVDTSEERTMIRNEARTSGRTNKSTEIIEKLSGPGFVTEYHTPHYRSDGREIGQGERTHSSRTATQSGGRGVRHGGTDGLQSGQKVSRDFLADGQLKGNYTVSEISEMFDTWNSDPELTELSKKVFAKLQEIQDNLSRPSSIPGFGRWPYPIRFKSEAYMRKEFYTAPHGVFADRRNDNNYGITYNLDYFKSVSDQEKAHVLLHEAIHACTIGAIAAAERKIPQYADHMEITTDDSWSEELKAGLELIQTFDQVRVANKGNEYGQKSVHEMVAEMSNPEFRTMLKKQRLWGRIVDAIKRIFGIEQRTAYDAVSDALEKILELDMPKAEADRYSERTGHSVSNRSLLANAFEGIVQNSDEYKMIQDYKDNIKHLNEMEDRLSDLNAEIRKIRFGTEGARDTKRLAELEKEAKETAKEINRYDKILMNLEASEPLRKVIERERKKEAQRTKAHVQKIQQNKKVRAEQTEIRHKIRKTVRDLDKLLKHGNKKTNVKEDMKGFVSKALELADYLFTDHISNDELIRKGITVRMTQKEAALVKETEDILTKLYDHADSLTDEEFTRLDERRKINETKLRDLLTAQRNERLNTPVYNLFNDLVTEYASLKNSKQDAVRAAYNVDLERLLRQFMGDTTDGTDSDRKKLLQNMRVADMTTAELNKLYEAYTMVLTNVRDANKVFVMSKYETIDKMADAITLDFSSRKTPDGKVAIVARNLSNKMGWDYEKLYYALDRIGSEAFTELVMNIANSENIVMQDVMEAAAFRDEMVKKYGYNNWKVNKEIDREFLDSTGKKFKLTLGQLMALYAYSRREGAWDHIEYGGFVFGEAALTNPRPADSYKLSKEQCEAITNLLTKEQKAYAEDMQKYLSETMGEKGNEVSMLLYGIKMFGEKNYFPIHIAGQFKAQANESQAKAAAGFSSMSNAGFTYAQNPNAKAPFVLEGFNEIWVDHVNEMSRYHGTVPALEDMRRVMNRSSYSESGADSMAIKQLMENSFGKEAVEYFDNLYREANSGAITDKLQKSSKKLLSLFRKNSVAYSLSVIIQQPSAMVRAYAMIPKKYFGFKGFGALSSGIAKAVTSKWTKAHTNAYNEMLKYAPGVTMAKEIGGFDTATGGSIRSYLLDTNKSFIQSMKTENVKGKAKAVLGLVDDNAIANLPNVADKIAWIEIWNACKREAVSKHKDLTPGSEEFMQAVGKRFTEVIRATQVYDSIFAKSPMLKSKNLAVQYLVSFMNEPNTTANMVEKAVRDATKGNWKGGVRVAAAVTASIIFNNVLKSIVYAMRDDDEDETYIEKYLEAVAGNLVSDFNALNYIPIARDVWSLAQGYDVERADMAIVADAIDAISKVVKNATKDTEDMTEDQLMEFDKKCTEANWKLVESLATFFGIPLKNIHREIEGVINTVKNTAANHGLTTKQSVLDKVYESVVGSIPFMQASKSKEEKLYEAIMSGDTAYEARLKSTYKNEDAYNSAVSKVLRENDPRIHQAAMAKYQGNTAAYKTIFRKIQSEGKFSFDDIMNAINSDLSKIKGETEPKSETSDYSSTDFVNAILLGETRAADAMRDDIISTKIANGKTQDEAEKSFADSIATAAHNAFDTGLLDEAGTEKMLVEYAGKDEEEAAAKVGYWAFCKAHPQYEISEEKVAKYHEFAEPADISLDVFVQFLDGTNGLKTIRDEWGDEVKSKREQVLEVIDSLPLTWQQKDALYLAYGYSESTILDVPW